MKFDLNIIASALDMARGCGKTYGAIKGAPKGAVVIAANGVHAAHLRDEVKSQGRKDLKVAIGNRGLLGLNGPFIADHFAVAAWLREALLENAKIRLERENWKSKYVCLKKEYDELKYRMDGLEK